MFSWLSLIPLLLIVFAASSGWSFVSKYKDMAQTIPKLEHQIYLRDARESSFRRRIDRRDAAIKASKCSKQIEYWVTHPDEVPKPFNPFNQLDNMGKKYGN